MSARLLLLCLASLCATAKSAAEPTAPKLLVLGLRLELIAAEPALVTPVGAAVNAAGEVFVIESHTHFPKDDYPGPRTDRVLRFSGRPGEAPVLFAEGFRWAMNLSFGPDGVLLLTHRNGVVRLADADRDGRADAPAPVLHLETQGDYPHNGLGGIAFGPDGWLYVGMGENLGREYTIRGSDRSAVFAPAGAGGLIVRCRPDGTRLQLWATGFWNAFALEFDAHGRLFMVDNDPDSRPPCRLVHVIRDGYYGFQFRHGRHGLNPFTAWNGELPGTLPMVAGTGEAPSSILDARRTGLPAGFNGTLLVAATWDHALERFRPVPVGASWRAEREVVLQGDAGFRPVALAAAPDGSLFITDWVKSDYSVHRHGRLWRLSNERPGEAAPHSLPPPNAEAQGLAHLLSGDPLPPSRLAPALASEDPFIHSAAVTRLAAQPIAAVTNTFRSTNPRVRTAALLALRKQLGRAGHPAGQTPGPKGSPANFHALLNAALADAPPEVRLAALVWIGEDKLLEHRPVLDQSLGSGPVTPLLLAVHAEAVKLTAPANRKPETGDSPAHAVRLLDLAPTDTDRFARATAALRAPDTDPLLRLEAIRDLAGTHETNAVAALQAIARDRTQPPAHRAEAILALTGSHEDHVTGLLPLLDEPQETVRLELVRALRYWTEAAGVKAALSRLLDRKLPPRLNEQVELALGRLQSRPSTDDDWRTTLGIIQGDPEIGRRVFFSPAASCAKCHRIEGRGGLVGTDLSTIARASGREKLLQSILHPSQDIAPQFAQHLVETTEGETYGGRLFAENADGSITLLNGESSAFVIPKSLVRANQPTATSLMPDGLTDGLTPHDLGDLLAYLEARR